MAVVAGVDFGTLSVRVSIVDSERGLLTSANAEYPLHRKREDPDCATQSHQDHMRALAAATREAVRKSGVPADQILALALDTTGSSVIRVGKNLQPLDDYYLWCDHRAKAEAAEITAAAHREKLAAIEWCGGVYSSEWGFSKLLHWLRHNPAKRAEFVSAFEHCDMVAATLCGITDAKEVKRSVCAMGHKSLWNASLGGLPPEEFLVKVDALFAGVREKIDGEFVSSDHLAGRLSAHWAEQLGLKAGIPIPVGAFDAHWDAIGAGCRSEDIVNVVGTSTCIIGITFGWNLQTTPQDELFAAIEGTALHTRVILDRMEEHGVIVRRVINAGGIPQKNDVLNQVYANVLGRPLLVPAGNVVSLGSAIFAFLAAGVFKSVEEAQDKICPQYKVFQPQVSAKGIYDKLYAFYSKIYFAFGRRQSADFGNLLPGLSQLSESADADATNE